MFWCPVPYCRWSSCSLPSRQRSPRGQAVVWTTRVSGRARRRSRCVRPMELSFTASRSELGRPAWCSDTSTGAITVSSSSSPRAREPRLPRADDRFPRKRCVLRWGRQTARPRYRGRGDPAAVGWCDADQARRRLDGRHGGPHRRRSDYACGRRRRQPVCRRSLPGPRRGPCRRAVSSPGEVRRRATRRSLRQRRSDADEGFEGERQGDPRRRRWASRFIASRRAVGEVARPSVSRAIADHRNGGCRVLCATFRAGMGGLRVSAMRFRLDRRSPAPRVPAPAGAPG